MWWGAKDVDELVPRMYGSQSAVWWWDVRCERSLHHGIEARGHIIEQRVRHWFDREAIIWRLIVRSKQFWAGEKRAGTFRRVGNFRYSICVAFVLPLATGHAGCKSLLWSRDGFGFVMRSLVMRQSWFCILPLSAYATLVLWTWWAKQS